jgi:hypothetical protein
MSSTCARAVPLKKYALNPIEFGVSRSGAYARACRLIDLVGGLTGARLSFSAVLGLLIFYSQTLIKRGIQSV